MTLYSHKSYLRAFKSFSKGEQQEINAAIARLPGTIGRPHEHSGAGVRRLYPGVLELRAGLRLRIVFTIRGEKVFLQTVGNHDHVQAWLRNNL